MTTPDREFDLDLSRRKLLAAAGIGGGAVVAASLLGSGAAEAATAARPAARSGGDAAGRRPPSAVRRGCIRRRWWCPGTRCSRSRPPRVMLGRLDGRLEQTVEAKGGQLHRREVGPDRLCLSCEARQAAADTAYLYAAMHDGAEPEFGTFRTSPRGRAPFTFTSFGDQGTPTLGKKFVPPAGVTLPNPPCVNDNLGVAGGGPTRRSASSGCSRCSISSTAISATPISPRTGCGPGGISGRTTAAAPATVPGCPRPATTRTSWATDRSAIRPIRPISRCRRRRARPR